MPSLKLEVIAARNVPKGDYMCNIICGKSKPQKTKTIKKTTSPEWNESFTINVEENDILKVELVEIKSIGNRKLGAISFPLNSLTKGKEVNSWESEGLENKAEVRFSVTAIDFGKIPLSSSTNEATSVKSKDVIQKVLPPMPSPAEVNKLYTELMEQIGLGKDFKHPTQYQTKQMADLSIENKWALVCQYKTIEVSKSKGKIEDTPQYWTSKLREGLSVSTLKDIRIILAGESLPWLQSFIEAGGLSTLLEILGNVEQTLHRRSMIEMVKKEDEQVEMQLEIVRCLQTLMNNKTGLNGVINTENGIRKLLLSMDLPSDEFRLRIIKILTVVCLVSSDGHRQIIESLTYFKAIKKEKYRFETLLRYLSTTQSVEQKTILLTFINTLVNSPTDIDLRISLRTEFQRAGLDQIIKELKEKLASQNDEDLETQIDVYEEESNFDFKELKERFDSFHININDLDEVFKVIKSQVKEAGLTPNLLSLVQNLLIIPVLTEKGQKSFLLLCRIARQIAFYKEKVGSEDDSTGVNLSELLVTVELESKEVPMKKKIEELEKELDLLMKKSESFQIEIKEKDEKISLLKQQLEEIRSKPFSDEIKSPEVVPVSTSDVPSPPDMNIPPPPDMNIPAPPDMNIPPPPDMNFPGPPGPPSLGAPVKVIKKKPKKNPQSKMKGLQWNKLPPNKVKGTIFENFSFEYKGIDIDYSELEEQFSAKVLEKKAEDEDKKKVQVISILDAKTSQNLSIFLSQYKSMNVETLCKNLSELNQKIFTLESVKQIIQCMPSKDDFANIDQYLQTGGDFNKLGAAEKFAFELNKIPSLVPLLQSFCFKLEFELKKTDIKPGVETLKAASKEILSSKRLPQLLEVILEIGNFINEGTPRGGLTAFKINTLLKLGDTKTTDNSSSLTQWLVKLLEKKSPELLKYMEEIPSIEKASRISITQLTSDVNTIQKDFSRAQSIVESFPDKGSKFVSIMQTFLSKAKEDIEQMGRSLKSMEEVYSDAVAYLGESPKETSPEEFFGILYKFGETIEDAKKQNAKAASDADKMKRREESKVKRQAEMDSKKTAAQDSVVEELFGALKGGNVFKNRRQQANPPTETTQQPVFPILKPTPKKV